MSEPNKSRMVKSDRTLFEIIEALIELDGATVTEIANEINGSKSTVHQHLSTMIDLGYAVKFNGEYNVGLRFLTIGEQARKKYEAANLAEEMVDQLAEETKERVQFFIEEHNRAIYVHTNAGERGVKANRYAGEIRYLHSSAGGKAILAEMDDDRVQSIIEQEGLPSETTKTIQDEEELFAELEEIRERGYSINKEESMEGLWAIGAAVVVDQNIVGSFSVSGPRHRLEKEWFHDELPDLLLSAANELEIKLQYGE